MDGKAWASCISRRLCWVRCRGHARRCTPSALALSPPTHLCHAGQQRCQARIVLNPHAVGVSPAVILQHNKGARVDGVGGEQRNTCAGCPQGAPAHSHSLILLRPTRLSPPSTHLEGVRLAAAVDQSAAQRVGVGVGRQQARHPVAGLGRGRGAGAGGRVGVRAR